MDDDAAKRRASRRKLNAVIGTMFLVAGLCFYAYNVERNLATHAPLVRACATLRRELPARMPEDLTRALFGADAPFMRHMLVDSYDHRCTEAERHTRWWQWNLGVKVDFSPPRAERERAAHILDDAATRCPAMVRQMLAELGHALGSTVPPRDVDHSVVEMCAPISDAAREERAHQLPMSAWDEASVLIAIAATFDDESAHPRHAAAGIHP